MRIRKVRAITYITFTSSDLPANNIYVGKSFEAIVVDETITGFKDWLQGGIKPPIGDYKKGQGWDYEMFYGSYTDNEVDRVTQKLQQKLSIHLGELIYPFEETSEIGVPYLNKKTQAEMDLILLEEISSTDGVAEVMSFDSTFNRDTRHYSLKFSVKTRGGEQLWLSTEA